MRASKKASSVSGRCDDDHVGLWLALPFNLAEAVKPTQPKKPALRTSTLNSTESLLPQWNAEMAGCGGE